MMGDVGKELHLPQVPLTLFPTWCSEVTCPPCQSLGFLRHTMEIIREPGPLLTMCQEMGRVLGTQ